MGVAKIIGSSSEGNAVVYNKNIMVDCGVSFMALQEVKNDLQLVLLTHKHSDHINLKTLQKLQDQRPSIRIACCEWMIEELPNIKNIDVLEIGKIYNYGNFKVSPVKLYHDVPNCGYRIFIENYKIFHATDTAHLEGISAKGYDLYAVEHNYDEDKALNAIKEAQEEGKYCHAIGSIETHLSWQQAREFINNNKKATSEILELHKSRSFYGNERRIRKDTGVFRNRCFGESRGTDRADKNTQCLYGTKWQNAGGCKTEIKREKSIRDF